MRRISWRWSLAAFAFTIEACSPAADFTVSSLPVAVVNVETSNQNHNGIEQGSVPPQIIDGTQSLVGLNNIPAFYGYTNGMKKLSFAAITSSTRAIGFDGSDIYVTGESYNATTEEYEGILCKVDNMTGAQLASLKVLTAGISGGIPSLLTISGKYLFVKVVEPGTFDSYVLGVDLTSMSAFSVKAKIPYPFICEDLLAVGGKLYIVARNSAIGEQETRLYVWNAINLTRQDTPDASYQVVNDDSEAKLAYDGRYLAIALKQLSRVDRFDTQDGTFTASWITLDSGEMALGIVTDGRSWFINSAKVSWTSDDPRIIRFYSTPTGMQRSAKQYGPILGVSGGPLAFDGTFLWASIGGKLVQLTTNLDVIAEIPTGETSVGPVVFDGLAIWSCLQGTTKIARLHRIVSGRQF